MLTFSINQSYSKVVRESDILQKKPVTEQGEGWWSTATFRYLQGKVSKNVDIDAYGYGCERNRTAKKIQKEVAILTSDDMEDYTRYGVAESVVKYIEDEFDQIVESSEVRTLVAEFLEAQRRIILFEGVNIWKLLKSSMTYNMSFVDKLREVIQKYEIEDLIKGVLTHKECMPIIEGIMD